MSDSSADPPPTQRPLISRALVPRPAAQRAGERRRVIPASYALHRQPAQATELVVRLRGGTITLDPQITGGCVIDLEEDSACLLCDQLTEWFWHTWPRDP